MEVKKGVWEDRGTGGRRMSYERGGAPEGKKGVSEGGR